MDNKRVKVKVLKINKELDKKTTSRGQDIFPIVADIELDGVFTDDVMVTAWGDKALESLKAGEELEATEREYRGEKEYTAFPPKKASSGGWGKPARNDGAIRRQCAYKGVIELVCAGKIGVQDIEKYLDTMDRLLECG